MYGLIGKMRAVPGKRDELVAILLDVGAMPGCRSYIVAADPNDPDAIWVTEIWTDKESHSASLQIPDVRAAIAKAMPIIAGFDSQTETVPLGGLGL
jgi:quinol monooxygenase YgiN